MKKFLVNIWAYDYHVKFEVLSEDNPQSLENAILDKLGEKSINWEYLGNSYDDRVNRITYEEVINDTRPLQTKKVLGVEVGTGASI
jgi:hypothetical protein